jgi:hypothetical protein
LEVGFRQQPDRRDAARHAAFHTIRRDGAFWRKALYSIYRPCCHYCSAQPFDERGAWTHSRVLRDKSRTSSQHFSKPTSFFALTAGCPRRPLVPAHALLAAAAPPPLIVWRQQAGSHVV